MAKPNYQFEKRQRELQKIKKQEEKRQKKLAGAAAVDSVNEADTMEAAATENTQPEQTP